MKYITTPLKFICSLPLYVIAFLAALFLMLAARGLDALYPEKKAAVTFMRAMLGFNTSTVSMEDGEPQDKPKAMGLRIYK